MKVLKKPSKESLNCVVMVLSENFEGLDADIVYKALKEYGGTTALPVLLTVKYVADYLKVEPKTIYEWMKQGKLRFKKISERGRGGNPEYRILESSLIEYIHAEKTDPAATEPV